MTKYAATVVLVIMVLTVGAHAQTADPPADPNWLKVLWKAIEPLWDAVVWPAIGVFAVMMVRKFLGERAAQILQEMLQAAAKRAAGKALAENTAPLVANLPSKELVASGVGYLKKTMPETIEKLKVSNDKLEDIVVANVGILMSPSVTGDKR